MSQYNKQYFIDKFTAIPEDEWCIRQYSNGKGQYCAAGHCGASQQMGGLSENPEVDALYDLFGMLDTVNYTMPFINDGDDPRYKQETPKQRILAALNDLP